MIKKFTCDNGVRIVMEEIPTVRSAAIGIWIATGSRDETLENNGISHFLEHMFFKGTETKTAKEIAESFDSIGGQVNAFTSKEYTCYYAKVLDNHAEYALETLADMFFNSAFDQEEMTKEKKVVAEEIKMYEDTPDDIVHDLLSKAVYKNHSLGYPILGNEETLASFTREKLKQYMYDMYTPERVVISIAGNVREELVNKADSLFGQYEGGSRPAGQSAPEFFSHKVSRKKETEQAHLCLGFEGLPIGHQDIYSLVALNNIVGGSMSSRLFQEVREQRGLAYSVFSYHSSFQDSGLVTIYGGTGADQLDQLFETIQETLATLLRTGVTVKELRNSKEQLKGSLVLNLESTSSRMSRNGKNELILKKHRPLDEVVRLIDEVSLESVNKMAQRLFNKDFSAALISPDGKLPVSL
ncbi:M16 family metallopeptidase [Bacillus xiapuensis]|uniref:M16 family metallopeptidase n=1 Tax=Bacillus xiapuensis TaxID=2014075 RepID=UPI000C246801|nr:pitrilysin family protein [Bacillus xiapuensis]